MRMEEKLHVVTCISNPIRFKSRYSLYADFAKRVADAGARLTTVEVAFGERPFEITDRSNPYHVQLRTRHELWHKENMLNIGIQNLHRVDQDWQYVAWVDADVQFSRPDWVGETVHQLQHFDVVQMFGQAQDLGPSGEPIGQQHIGFMYAYWHGMLKGLRPYEYASKGHPGYAWAARRSALDKVGGLIDFAILGAADTHMATALIGKLRDSVSGGLHSRYVKELARWEERAEKNIRRKVGYVPGLLTHYWHGKKRDRKYIERWKILIDHQYDPDRDLKRDTGGLWQLVDDGSPHSIVLRDDIRKYFRARNEDSIDLC